MVDDARVDADVAHDVVVVGDAKAFAVEVFVQVLAEEAQEGVGIAKIVVAEEGGKGGSRIETDLWFHGVSRATVAT